VLRWIAYWLVALPIGGPNATDLVEPLRTSGRSPHTREAAGDRRKTVFASTLARTPLAASFIQGDCDADELQTSQLARKVARCLGPWLEPHHNRRWSPSTVKQRRRRRLGYNQFLRV